MREFPYHLVDVFTDKPFGGNQLAVFTDGTGLSDATMQLIARELNLSETVFVLPPQDNTHHARLRIFTPKREVPIAGHPTVGTGYVLARDGHIPSSGNVIFEEGVGPITVTLHQDGDIIRVEMQQPIPTFNTDHSARRTELAAMLSLPDDAVRSDLPSQVLSAGVPFLYIPLKDRATVDRAHLRHDLWDAFSHETDPVDIFILTTETVDPTSVVYSRMFAPTMDIPEDPATGAASGPLGAYLVTYGLVSPGQASNMTAEQGYAMGRPSRIGIHVTVDGDQIERVSISGVSRSVGRGVLYVPEYQTT